MPHNFSQLHYLGMMKPEEDFLCIDASNHRTGNMRKRAAQPEGLTSFVTENNGIPWIKRSRFDNVNETNENIINVNPDDCAMEVIDDENGLSVERKTQDSARLPVTVINGSINNNDLNGISPSNGTANFNHMSPNDAPAVGCAYYVPSGGGLRERDLQALQAREIEDNRARAEETRHHRRQWGYMDHYFSAGHWF